MNIEMIEQAKLQAEQAEADRFAAQVAHEAEVVAAVDAACDELHQEVSTWYGIVGIKHAEPEPSDGDLIWTAQTAIAAEYGMTTQQAFNRLKAIDWTL